MSLFKIKEYWSHQCTTEEDFDQNSLVVSKVNSSFDFVLIGSHNGIFRIYKPSCDINSTDINYKPNDLLIEKSLANPILQIGVGKLVSGSQQSQIAILHPRSINVYNLNIKEGIADHGTQIMLSLTYEHKLRRSAYNFVNGPFGGIQNRDFICIQSLDGMLTFFEQENFSFSCFLPDFLLPGPLVFVKSSDSFITMGSNWCVESYKYKTLSEVGQGVNQDDMSGRKVNSHWSFNLGENVIDAQSKYDDNSRQSFISVLGEKHLFCFSDSGRLIFMKKLYFSPTSFHMYYLDDGKLMLLVISETNTLLVYQQTTLKWSAKLEFLPIAISRAFFQEVPGALVMLSEDGYLSCSYLGTEPNLFSAPPLKNQDLDFEKAEAELSTLNKMIKTTLNSDIDLANSTADRELLITVTVNPHLKDSICESAQTMDGQKCCEVVIEINPHAIFEEVQVSMFVQKPLIVTPQVRFYTNLSDTVKFSCNVYLQECIDVPSLDLEVTVSFVSSLGVPRLKYSKVTLPLHMVMETCAPMKESEHKVTLNINQNPVSLSTLFPEFTGENSLTMGSSAIGFKNILTNTIVCVLLAKSSQRYRLQSDSISSLNILVQEVIRRLKVNFSGNEDFVISFNSALPIVEVIASINGHFQIGERVNKLENDLSQISSQFRLIQKRLISKFKQKNPTPLVNLDILVQDTYTELLEIITQLEQEQKNLSRSQINLSCVLHLLLGLLKIMDTGKQMPMVEQTLSPYIYDVAGQRWEEVLDASLCYLLRTVLAKSEKDKLRAPHTSYEEVKEIAKLEKHFTQVLERVLKKGPVMETNFEKEDSKKEIQEETLTENTEEVSDIGTAIATSSSRILSARRSLLKKRQKIED